MGGGVNTGLARAAAKVATNPDLAFGTAVEEVKHECAAQAGHDGGTVRATAPLVCAPAGARSLTPAPSRQPPSPRPTTTGAKD